MGTNSDEKHLAHPDSPALSAGIVAARLTELEEKDRWPDSWMSAPNPSHSCGWLLTFCMVFVSLFLNGGSILRLCGG
jgi:hypothetical protein